MITENKKLYSILYDFFKIKSFKEQQKEFPDLCSQYGLSHIFNIIDQYFPYQYLLPLYQVMPSLKRRTVKTIAFVVHSLGIGGIERVTAILTREFSELGYDILVLTEQPFSPSDYKLPENICCMHIPEDSRYFFFDKILEYCDVIIYQNFLSEKYYIDLLYFRFKGIIFIYCFHNMALNQLYTNPKGYCTEDLIYPYLDVLVCLSQYDQIYWKEKNVPAVYIPNPLTFNPDSIPQASLESKNILFVGRFSPEKRTDFLFEAFQDVLKKIPDARLMMIGDSNIRLEAELSAKKMGINNSIDFLGFHEDITPFLLNAAIHVMPSQYEGMPMVWIEAKAFGIPTIYTKMNYLEMDSLGGAISTEKNDPHTFAEELITLLTNDKMRKTLGYQARDSLKHFKTEISIKRWQLLFEALGSGTLAESELIDSNPRISKQEVFNTFRDEKILALQSHIHIKHYSNNKIAPLIISFIKKYILPPNTRRRIAIKNIINYFKGLY